MFDQFCELFRYLPIATIVNKAVFVVHGGLFHRGNVKISDLETIEREKYEGELEDPKSPENINDARGYDLRSLMLEALWSDPNPDPMHVVSLNPRGAGVSFGGDIVRQFLQVNKLSFIVRSHECVINGYQFPFESTNISNKLCTLFSASNYEGRGNVAAFMLFQASAFTGATKISENSNLHYTIETFTTSEGDNGENECKDLLQDLILKKFKALHLNFSAADSGGTGKISLEAWAEVMRSVTKVNVAWTSLAGAIIPAIARSGTDVYYAEFLQKFKRADNGNEHVELYAERPKLEAIFRFFDTDGNGAISREEFKNGCDAINKILPPEKQITDPDAILNMMDYDGSDSIDVNEFFEVMSDFISDHIDT